MYAWGKNAKILPKRGPLTHPADNAPCPMKTRILPVRCVFWCKIARAGVLLGGEPPDTAAGTFWCRSGPMFWVRIACPGQILCNSVGDADAVRWLQGKVQSRGRRRGHNTNAQFPPGPEMADVRGGGVSARLGKHHAMVRVEVAFQQDLGNRETHCGDALVRGPFYGLALCSGLPGTFWRW